MNRNIRLGSAESRGFDFRSATRATMHRRGANVFDRAFARSVIGDSLVLATGAGHRMSCRCRRGDGGGRCQLDLALSAFDDVPGRGTERHRDEGRQ